MRPEAMAGAPNRPGCQAVHTQTRNDTDVTKLRPPISTSTHSRPLQKYANSHSTHRRARSKTIILPPSTYHLPPSPPTRPIVAPPPFPYSERLRVPHPPCSPRTSCNPRPFTLQVPSSTLTSPFPFSHVCSSSGPSFPTPRLSPFRNPRTPSRPSVPPSKKPEYRPR